MDDGDARRLLRACFDAGVAAADPHAVLAAHLPGRPRGRCVVVGAGKAAATMAAALEAAWPDVPLEGAVVTRDGHAVPTARIAVLEASHPVPDARSEAAARRMLDLVRGLGPDDLVLALMSGGGSALLTLPAPGLTLADKQVVNAALLRSGAPIEAMNTVRKAMSAIKGGRLAEACRPAQVVTLLISDVPGDRPDTIASGPTVPDTTTRAEAARVLARYGIDPPMAVARLLATAEPARPAAAATPVDIRLIAAPILSLRAAAETARAAGVTPVILGDAFEGESRVLAETVAAVAFSARRHGAPAPAPALLLSGGETTVRFAPGAPAGRGGRNTEFALALALALEGARSIWALAGDSDGIDGIDTAAGAIVTPDTLARARACGLDPAEALDRHDSATLFERLDDLIVTGPTLTNVNDLRLLLVA